MNSIKTSAAGRWAVNERLKTKIVDLTPTKNGHVSLGIVVDF